VGRGPATHDLISPFIPAGGATSHKKGRINAMAGSPGWKIWRRLLLGFLRRADPAIEVAVYGLHIPVIERGERLRVPAGRKGQAAVVIRWGELDRFDRLGQWHAVRVLRRLDGIHPSLSMDIIGPSGKRGHIISTLALPSPS